MANQQGVDYIDPHLDDEDVTDWDGGGFDPPENGRYEFEVTGVEQKNSRGGKPMLVVTSEVVADIYGDETDQAGKSVTARYMLVGKGRGRLKHFVDCVIKRDARGGFSMRALRGKHFLATVSLGTYEYTDEDTGEEKSGTSVNLLKELSVDARPAKEPEDADDGDDLPPEDGGEGGDTDGDTTGDGDGDGGDADTGDGDADGGDGDGDGDGDDLPPEPEPEPEPAPRKVQPGKQNVKPGKPTVAPKTNKPASAPAKGSKRR